MLNRHLPSPSSQAGRDFGHRVEGPPVASVAASVVLTAGPAGLSGPGLPCVPL